MNILTDNSPTALAAAAEANWLDAMRCFGLAPSVSIRDDHELFWFITGLPDGSFNSIMYANLALDRIDAAVAALRQLRRTHRVPVGWLIGPGSRPTDLAAQLTNRGLRHISDLTPMSFDLAQPIGAPLPPGLAIEAVQDKTALHEWIEAERLGFETEEDVAPGLAAMRRDMGVPAGQPLCYYLGRLHGVPVATASLVLSAGVAGLFDISTVPTARRRGIGAAMTCAMLGIAQANGYRFAFLNPSEMGYPLYERIGFRALPGWPVFV